MIQLSVHYVPQEIALKLPNSPGKLKSRIHLYDIPWDPGKGDRYAIAAKKLSMPARGNAPKLSWLDKRYYFLFKTIENGETVWYKINKNSFKKRLDLTSPELKSVIDKNGIATAGFVTLIQKKQPGGSGKKHSLREKNREEQTVPKTSRRTPRLINEIKKEQLAETSKEQTPITPEKNEQPISVETLLTKHLQSVKAPNPRAPQSSTTLEVHKELAKTNEEPPKIHKEEKKLPPLPPLLTYTIDPTSSLNQVEFIEDEAFIILETPLSHIANKELRTRAEQFEIEIAQTQPIGQKIKNRLSAFEKELQLKERLKRLNNPERPKIQDLVPAWPNSPMKFLLMMDEEIAQFTSSHLKTIDTHLFYTAVGDRIYEISKRYDRKIPSPLSQEVVADLPLIQFCKLKATELEAYAEYLPPIAYVLAPPVELKKINLSLLSDDQINMIFHSKKHLEALTVEKINAVANKVKNPKLFENLTESQALGVNLTQLENKQEVFNVIYFYNKEYMNCEGEKRIPKKDLEWIYANQELFSDDHWKCLAEPQVLSLDLSRIKPAKQQQVFNTLFYYNKEYLSTEADRLIPKKKLQWIYDNHKFFSDDHWKCLGDDQALAFDFSKIENKEKRRQVFDIVYYYNREIITPKAETLIQQQPVEWIYANEELFKPYHWKCLGDDQALAFDFSKIENKEKRKKIFNIVYQYDSNIITPKAEKLIQQQPVDWIYSNQELFTEDHWKCFSEDQKQKLDPKRLINKILS